MESLALHRRDVLQAGALGGIALGGAAWLSSLSQALADEPPKVTKRRRARSVIVLWLGGGPSQLETFDPHPDSKIAGDTKAIDTTARGLQLAEGYERLAEQMKHVSLVRSLVSKEGDHERGTYLGKTGYRPMPAILHPSLGAIVCHEHDKQDLDAEGVPKGGIPRHVSILPNQWAGRGGFLGARYDAFKTDDPQRKVPDVTARVPEERAKRRLADLDVVERAFGRGRAAQSRKTMHRQLMAAAGKMMASEHLTAFDVSSESQTVRDRYGDTPFGRGCLAARRLVAVGVRCVEVTLDGWDTHAANHSGHRTQAAILDPAFAALIDDLKEHDLLDETVVVCGGEFGRTPRINPAAGRDHWPHGFTWAIAGGGVKGGQVIGATDPTGGKKVERPQRVADVHATVLSAFGLDPKDELTSNSGRPTKLSDGKVIGELLG
jgi:hypothetical protein